MIYFRLYDTAKTNTDRYHLSLSSFLCRFVRVSFIISGHHNSQISVVYLRIVVRKYNQNSNQKWQESFIGCPDMSDTRAIEKNQRLLPNDLCLCFLCGSHTVSSVHAIVTCGDMNEYICIQCIRHLHTLHAS